MNVTPNSPSLHSRNTPPTHYGPADDYYTPPYSPAAYPPVPYSPQRPEYESRNSTEDEEQYQG